MSEFWSEFCLDHGLSFLQRSQKNWERGRRMSIENERGKNLGHSDVGVSLTRGKSLGHSDVKDFIDNVNA